MCVCVGEEDAEKGRGDGLTTKLSSVCLRYQLVDDGLLKLGDPKATVRLWEVSRRKREARSKATRPSANAQQHKGAGGIYAELETESEKQR